MRSVALAFVLAVGACSNPPSPVDTGPAPLLEPPEPGKGYQVNFGPFDVTKRTEVQLCRTLKLPNDQPIAVDRLQVKMSTGSHHFILFRSEKDFPDNVFPCWGTVNFDDFDFMLDVNASGGYDWKLEDSPGDVQGFVLRPHQQIMIQSHYVNGSSVETPDGGMSSLNLYTRPASELTHEVRGLFTVNTKIAIPPHSTYATPPKKCTPSADIQIVAMTGHFHARGRVFSVDHMALGDAYNNLPDTVEAPLYQSQSWDSPPFKIFTGAESQYAVIGYGTQAVQFQCTYDNTDPNGNTYDMTVGFGGHADVQEHCNLFLQYYRLDGKNEPVYCTEGSGGW